MDLSNEADGDNTRSRRHGLRIRPCGVAEMNDGIPTTLVKREIRTRRAQLSQRVEDEFQAYQLEVIRLAALPETELMEREREIEAQLSTLYRVFLGIMGNHRGRGKKKRGPSGRANPKSSEPGLRNVHNEQSEPPASAFSNREVK
jgi:hypothetical protein